MDTKNKKRKGNATPNNFIAFFNPPTNNKDPKRFIFSPLLSTEFNLLKINK